MAEETIHLKRFVCNEPVSWQAMASVIGDKKTTL
jgi:hypothetical protein